jgi:hypothetical protein
MNTLTISIALLVLVTLLAVAIHSAWQSYSGHKRRKLKDSPHDSETSETLAIRTDTQPHRLRPEPSLDAVLAQDSLVDVNDSLIEADRPQPLIEATKIGEPMLAADHQASALDSTMAFPELATLANPSDSIAFSLPNAAVAATTSVDAKSTEANAEAAKEVQSRSFLNERVDCIVEFALEAPIAGQRLLHATQTIRRFGSKAASFDGTSAAAADSQVDIPAAGAESNESAWQPIDPTRSYRSFRMGVLLANRHGALNALEFAEFAETAHKLAGHFGALAVIPDMSKTLGIARALDAECIKLDAQLGLNIDCSSALNLTELTRLARDQGLVDRGGNRYARMGRGDELLFMLSPADLANRLTLLLDVPRAPIDQQPWAALLSCAHETMTGLKGHLVDDSGRPLNTRNLDSLSAELAQRYAMLDQSGFKAGSALALRVFN